MRLLRLVSALFIIAVTGVGGVAFTQETDTKWLVGVWEGESAVRASTHPAKYTVAFKDEGGIIWELEVDWRPSGLSKARGSAKVLGEIVEMKGAYYAGRATSGLSISLTRRGEVLEGVLVGALNVPIAVSWREMK